MIWNFASPYNLKFGRCIYTLKMKKLDEYFVLRIKNYIYLVVQLVKSFRRFLLV